MRPHALFLTLSVVASNLLLVACGGSKAGPAADGGVQGAGLSACGLSNEPQGNHTRDTAAAYTLGTAVHGCVDTATEEDWFEFTAPADPAGGYVLYSVSNVGSGNVQVDTFVATDNGQLSSLYSTTLGQSLNGYLAVAPGVKYRLRVKDFSGGNPPYVFTLQANYTKVNDTFEPNDSSAAAKTITVNTPISAYSFAGATAATYPAAAFDDWYSVTLGTAPVEVKLENVPTNIDGQLNVFDSTGTNVASTYSVTPGASQTASFTPAAAGTYTVKVDIFTAGPNASDTGTTAPDNFTRPYKLTVVQ